MGRDTPRPCGGMAGMRDGWGITEGCRVGRTAERVVFASYLNGVSGAEEEVWLMSDFLHFAKTAR